MNAKLADMVAVSMSSSGGTPSLSARGESIGRNAATTTMLVVTSVRKAMTTPINTIMTRVGMPSKKPSPPAIQSVIPYW